PRERDRRAARRRGDRRAQARGARRRRRLGGGGGTLAPMNRAAAERGAAPVEEPDRLEGFSSPREVDRLFGHDAARAEFGDALISGRLHHAWLLVGPEGVGKATLAYHLARDVLALGEAGAG